MTASQTSPTRKSPKFYAAIIGAAVLIIGVAVAGWLLMRDDEQTSQGVCNNRAYELSVEPSDGQLEVSFELSGDAGATLGWHAGEDSSVDEEAANART